MADHKDQVEQIDKEEFLFNKFGLLDKDGYLYPPSHKNVLVFIELKKQLDNKKQHTPEEKLLWIQSTETFNLYDENVKEYEKEFF